MLLPMIMTSFETPHGRTVVSPLRLSAVTHDAHFDRRIYEREFALFCNDILTFLHRGNSPPENSCWKCDPHAGWESHFSKQAKKSEARMDCTNQKSCNILWLFSGNQFV